MTAGQLPKPQQLPVTQMTAGQLPNLQQLPLTQMTPAQLPKPQQLPLSQMTVTPPPKPQQLPVTHDDPGSVVHSRSNSRRVRSLRSRRQIPGSSRSVKHQTPDAFGFAGGVRAWRPAPGPARGPSGSRAGYYGPTVAGPPGGNRPREMGR